jgi:arginase
MRSNGLLQSLTSLGWRVNDTGDLDFEKLAEESTHTFDDTHELEKAKNSDIVGRGCKMIADVVSEELTHGRFPLILGGDHSIGIGSLAGILSVRPNTGVIWVDAHADINTPEMSESGNMHGMPIAFVMEGMMKNPHQIRGFEWLKARNARLSPESLVYIGLRDVDAAERDVMKKMGIKAFTMHEIDRYGIGTVMDLAFSHLFHNNADRPIHVSYDVDAVDPIFAPATGTTVRGGLTFREAHYVAESIARCGNLASAEIVEVNPTLSDGKGGMETLDLSLGLVTSLLGKSVI